MSKKPSPTAAPLFAFTQQSRHTKAAHEIVRLIERAYKDRNAPGHTPRSIEDLGERFKKLMQRGDVALWNAAIELMHARNAACARQKEALLAAETQQKADAAKKAAAQADKQNKKKKNAKPVDPKDTFDPFESKLGKTRLIDDSKPATYLQEYEPVRPVMYNVILECAAAGKICISGVNFGGAILRNFEIRKADLSGVNFDDVNADRTGLKIQSCTYDAGRAPSFKGASIQNALIENLRRDASDMLKAEKKLQTALSTARLNAKEDVQAAKDKIASIRTAQTDRLAADGKRKPGASEPTIKAAQAALKATRSKHAKIIRAARGEIKALVQSGAINFNRANLLNVRFINCDLPFANLLGAVLFEKTPAGGIRKAATFMTCDLTGAKSYDRALETVTPQKPRDRVPAPMPAKLAQFWQSIPDGGQVPYRKSRARGAFALTVVQTAPQQDDTAAPASAPKQRRTKPKPE